MSLTVCAGSVLPFVALTSKLFLQEFGRGLSMPLDFLESFVVGFHNLVNSVHS